MESKVKFKIGQLIEHRLFGYRGVVYDVDSVYSMDDEWYEQMAKSKPPKNEPWYRVLVHNASYTTYVAEKNLATDASDDQINHPDLGKHFSHFIDGQYLSKS